jgi:hypothetical protein
MENGEENQQKGPIIINRPGNKQSRKNKRLCPIPWPTAVLASFFPSFHSIRFNGRFGDLGGLGMTNGLVRSQKHSKPCAFLFLLVLAPKE